MGTIGISTDGYLADPPLGEVRLGMLKGPTRQWQLVVAAVVTASIASLTVGLRLFTRMQIVRGKVSVDDYLVLAALAFSVTTIVVTLLQTDYGLSFHKWDILFAVWNIWYPVYDIIGTCTYALCVMCSKISILFFYLRLSPQTWFRWCSWGLITASVVYTIIYVFLVILPCHPIQGNWDYSIESTCLDPWTAYRALSILNIIMDVLTLLLPIPVVLSLQMGKGQKFSLMLLFTAGVFVCAIAIRRTTLIPVLYASSDRTWDSVEDYMLSYAEMNVGILCASVPALKPLFTTSPCCCCHPLAAAGTTVRNRNPSAKLTTGGSSSLSRSAGGRSLSSSFGGSRGLYYSSGGGSILDELPQSSPRRLTLSQLRRLSGGGGGDSGGGGGGGGDEAEEDQRAFRLDSLDDAGRRSCWYDGTPLNDEGVHLWRVPSREGLGVLAALEKAVLAGATATEHIYDGASPPGSSAEELRTRGAAVYDARATAATPRPVWNSGITVTRETTIHYEQEW